MQLNKLLMIERIALSPSLNEAFFSERKALAYASDARRKDLDLCSEAIKQNAAALQVVHKEVRTNDRLVSEALDAFGRGLQVKLTEEEERIRQWEHINQESMQALKFSEDSRNKANKDNSPERSKLAVVRVDSKHTTADSFTRIVPLVALRVIRANGAVLAQVGNIEKAKLTAEASFPGMKIEDREDPRDTVQRLIASRLAPWSKWIRVNPIYESVVEEGTSLSAKGVQTRYLRAIFTAHLDEKMPWTRDLDFIPGAVGNQSSHRAMANIAKLSHRFSKSVSNPEPPDIFMFRIDPMPRKILLYAWVPDFEYQWLRYSDTGKDSLGTWISQLKFPPSVNVDLSGGIVSRKTLAQESFLVPLSRPSTSRCNSSQTKSKEDSMTASFTLHHPSTKSAFHAHADSCNQNSKTWSAGFHAFRPGTAGWSQCGDSPWNHTGSQSTLSSTSPRKWPPSSRHKDLLPIVCNSHHDWLRHRSMLTSHRL